MRLGIKIKSMKTCRSGKVLVSDANSRRGLAVVRSLGRRGLQVTAGDDHPYGLSFTSKFCTDRLLYPNPEKSPEKFTSFMLNHLRNNPYDCFFPMSDAVVKQVALHLRDFTSLTNIILEDYETLAVGFDKWRTIELARTLDIPHPKTFYIDDLETVRRLQNKIPYPTVIKPRFGSGAKGVVFVYKPEDLWSRYLCVHQNFRFPLLQEAIPPTSPKFGVQCLSNRKGQIRAAVVQRFCRQYPYTGGPGSCFETVDRPDILTLGTGLMEKLGWQGVAQIEFLEDERDGVLKLMEINPRFWDSLQMVIQAGVDFPYLLYRIAVDGDVESNMAYRTGEVCRSLLPGEILYFLTNLHHLDVGPSFWRFYGPNLGYCILSREDKRPTLNFFWVALNSLFDREVLDAVFHRLGPRSENKNKSV